MAEDSVLVDNNRFDYWAFISYSHSDILTAKWLHKAMEAYRIPRSVVRKMGFVGQTVPKRLFPVFLDREELAGAPDLNESVKAALRASRCLIIVCSTSAARSNWVNAEASYFIKAGWRSRILLLIAKENEIGSREDIRQFLPPALRQETYDATEPLAADLREGGDGARGALLKLVAGVIGVKFRELSEREHGRQIFRRAIFAAILFALSIVGGAAWEHMDKLERANIALQPKQPTAGVRIEQQNLVSFVKSRNLPIDISVSGYELQMTIGMDGIFAVGDTQLSSRGQMSLSHLMEYLKSRGFAHISEVQVYAHTDQTPIASSRGSNWMLSAMRAVNVVTAMEHMGLDPHHVRVTPIAPGEYRPLREGANRINRRLELRIIYLD